MLPTTATRWTSMVEATPWNMAHERYNGSTSSVLWPRLILSLLLGSMVLLPQMYKSTLDPAWTYLSSLSIYRASTFEKFWTVFCYAIIEAASYTYRFAHNPQLQLANQRSSDGPRVLPKMQRPKHRVREGLRYVAPLLLMNIIMIKKFSGVSVCDMALTGNYDPSQVDMTGDFLAPTLHRPTWSSPLQTQRALPDAAPSSRQLVLQLVCSILIYDSVFFWFHLALHKLPLLNRVHGFHHKHHEINSQITNQLDIVERLGLVLLANFSLNIIGSHVFDAYAIRAHVCEVTCRYTLGHGSSIGI